MQVLRTTVAAMAVLSSSFTFVGCGPSQEEMLMQAARRPRVDADKEDSVKPPVDNSSPATPSPANGAVVPPSAAANTAPSNNSQANPSTQERIAPNPASGSVVAGDTSVPGTPNSSQAPAQPDANPQSITSNFQPIADRKPTETLDENARAARSAENMKAIGEALVRYCKEKNRFPLPAMKSSGGLPTLSWRVELLPWLGYEDLYKQFDPNQPWDSPANMRLLEFIPDCYASPERFDTNTNYLAVSGRSYLFNGEPVVLRKIEDGLDNTLAVVEVNDTVVVPWTCPEDFVFERGSAAASLGGLRPGGSFALWANGWLTLIREGIGEELLHKAFTYESGDGVVAPEIHQPVRFSNNAAKPGASSTQDRVASKSAGGSNNTSAEDNLRTPTGVEGTSVGLAAPAKRSLEREEVPSLAALSAARERIEPIFGPKFRDARDLAQRKQIANEMLEAAATMTADPAGAFALQTAAIEAFASMGQFEDVFKAVDAQVVRFNVDAKKTNVDALALFAQKNNSALAARVDNREFLRRFVPTAMLALEEDLYDPLLEIVPAAIAIENQQRQRTWIADLNRLKQQLTSARNQFRQLGDALDQLRREPTNPEANYLVGRYVAFIRGDWQTGLPLLGLGNNERLAAIATLDLATPSSPSAMLKTADQWWDLGEATNNELFKGSCHQRALHWYRSAYEQLPDSLERLHAKTKLEDCEATEGGSPRATLEGLAEKLGIQLEASKARIMDPSKEQLTKGDIDP